MADTQAPVHEAWRVELKRGLTSLRGGQFERAETHFERAYRWGPDRPEVCYALGRARLRRGDSIGAEPLLRTAWERDETLVSAASTLARCLALYLDRPDEGLTVLDEAERRAGSSASLHVVRSELLIEAGRLEEARQSAEAALATDADELETSAARAALARVANQSGIDLASRGEYEPALFAFKRAADLDPAWSSPHVNMGAAFGNMGRSTRARSSYESAIALDPQNAIGYANLGLQCREAGDMAGAIEALEMALALEPSLNTIADSLAELYIDVGAADIAVDMLEAAVNRAPTDPDALIRLASALGASGQFEQAESLCRSALTLTPGHVGACKRLADILARQGRYLEAAVLTQRAHAVEPAAREPRGETRSSDETDAEAKQ